jgi:hypothetical protein
MQTGETHHLSPEVAARAARVLGSLSIASGMALALAPRRMARVYGLPAREGLVRTLGARDVLIGAMMMAPRSSAAGCLARAVSDFVDAGMIVSEHRREHARPWLTSLRVAGALGLVAGSAWLGTCLAGQPTSASRFRT